MYSFEELEERYTPLPRKMDMYLRPITYVDTGDSLPFPAVKLTLATLAIVGLCYWITMQFEMAGEFVAFIGASIMLGVGIQIVRSGSTSERNARLFQQAPLVYGRVVQGAQHLYREGTERGQVSVVFTRDETNRRDTFYLKDVAKRLRAAIESRNPRAELADATALIKNTSGRAIHLPEDIGADGDSWLAVIEVNPERLPEGKLVKQHVLLLVAPESNLVAQL